MSLYSIYLYVYRLFIEYRQAYKIPQDIYVQKNIGSSHTAPYFQTFEPFIFCLS